MADIRLKIILILLILFPVSFSCEDKNECMDLYVEPYFDIQNIAFIEVLTYSRNKVGNLNFEASGQDYDNQEYACDSMALYFMAPDTSLVYHSQHVIKPKFGLIPEAYACNSNRPGYAGTRELVDKIYVSSNYDFDETHSRNDNLGDIVDIYAYTPGGSSRWMQLSDFNRNSPYEAPKRFYLLFKRKPTMSNVQQFVVKYYMQTEEGVSNEYYIITTPVLNVR